MSDIFDPTTFPYVRAQTYVDNNPPAVLADEFYNPVQDALARLFGATTGYSTTISSEEFERLQLLFTPVVGDLLGDELAVVVQPGGFQAQSIIPATANMHGVVHIDGTMAGDRGGTAFEFADASRYVGILNWIFRARVRCSNFAVSTIAFGLGGPGSGLPLWYAPTGGFWGIGWEASSANTLIPVVDNEWIDLWITLRDRDGMVRWYAKRDTDPLPVLIDTQTLMTPSLVDVRRYVSYEVSGGAAALDYIELDNISLAVER